MDQVQIDLTVRHESTGGAPRDFVYGIRRFYRNAAWLDRVILVHGFRTSEENALSNYRIFQIRTSGASAELADRLYGFSWPGDSGYLADPTYFRRMEGQADHCGEVLADFLSDEIADGSPIRYIFVAHSLGCRLILQALTRVLRRFPHLRRRYHLFLMAAAIPTSMLAPGTDQRSALQSLAFAHPLSSSADWVLRDIFPRGSGVRRARAVGLAGEPKGEHWAVPEPGVTSGLTHDQYWPDQDGRIGRYIARQLGLPVDAPLGEARLPEASALPSADLPARGPLDRRTL